MRKTILAGVLAAGAVAVVAGTASTNSNTVPASVAGYGSANVTGATVESIAYTFSADRKTITAAALVLDGDVSAGKIIEAGFGAAAPTPCVAGTYDAGTTATPVTCTFSQDTATAVNFYVAVRATDSTATA